MTPPKTIRVAPGDRYGRLSVLAEVRLPNTPGRVRHGFRQGPRGALCRCDCGAEVKVAATRLTSGNTKSCGCLRSETAITSLAVAAAANLTHGLSRRGDRSLYDTWMSMMARCSNPGHRYYARYGGRGIAVCERWHDVVNFVADINALLGSRPAGFTLDRIENDGNYEPGNVRWADRRTQSQNRDLSRMRSPFTEDQVARMRAMREGGAVLREIAEAYGISIAAAHRHTRSP